MTARKKDPQTQGRTTKPSPKKGRKRPPPRSNKTALEAHRKRIQCMELRMGGMTFAQIAKEVGYADKGACYKAWQTGMAEAIRVPATEALELELQRLDALLHALWPNASTGDTQATDRVIKIMERRAKLLGLDVQKTIPINITGYEGWSDEELDRFSRTGKRPGDY